MQASKASVFAALGLLCHGCRSGNGMRSDSSNRFAPAPPGVPFIECAIGGRSALGTIEVEEGRRVAAEDWVPGEGGVVVISDESSRFAHQELFFVPTSGSLQPMPLPPFLKSPINEVHLLPGPQPLLIVGEAWARGGELTRALLEEVLGIPDHGDLVVMDLAGVERVRHRSAHCGLLSPDFRWLAYWRSGDDGLHNLLVARPEQESAVFVGAIVESDPGSGMSFAACWSADSRYLHVSGSAMGWRSFSWTYDAVAQELYANAG